MVGEKLTKRYQLMEQIGGGGMALVYKAFDEVLNRNVAIKILRQQFVNDEEFVQRFRREAQAAASLSHPNVVSIYDVGQEHDTYFIVMEYIEGQTLMERIKQQAPMVVDQAVNIVSQICDALEHAHQNQIIHRDIKPHNILIGKNGRVKVTDFGIARAVTSSTITQAGSVIGSVHYFSPEHAKGVTTDEKSDLYSLGIVLYQMLTNQLPFTGESPISVALKHLQDTFTEPRVMNPLVPQSVENIILKSMRRNAYERFQSAQEMLEALERCLLPEHLHEAKIQFASNSDDGDDMDTTRVIPAIRPGASNGQLKPESETTSNANGSKSDLNKPKTNGSSLPPLTRSDRQANDPNKPNGKQTYPKWAKPAAYVGGFGVILLVVIWIIASLNGSLKVEDVMVPDLSNKPLVEAQNQLSMVGLFAEVIYEASDQVAKDVVIRQDRSGMNVKKNSIIKLFVSTGQTASKMVSVLKMNLPDAMVAIQKLGIPVEQIQVDHIFSEDPIDTVLDQFPDADADISAQTTMIKLTVSQGKEAFAMPNLLGLSENEAKAQLLKNNLKLAAVDGVEYSESYMYSKGQVWKQSTEPDEPIAPGAEIKLYVSSGYPSDAKEINYNVMVMPVNEGEQAAIRITYTDARGNDLEWGNRSISKLASFPVRLVLSPAQNGVITIYRNSQIYNLITISYDGQISELKQSEQGVDESTTGEDVLDENTDAGIN